MANTRETMGEQACLDSLVANTLTSLEDDGITKVGEYCLRYHTALTDVKLPICKDVEQYGLAGCTSLEAVDMQGTGNIAANAFDGDTSLVHLLLRGSTMTTLYSTNAFASTPISLGNGAVYVPSDLLATYKANNNWKNYAVLPLSAYPATDFSTITDSWDTIIAKAEAGTAASSYSIGDTKLLDLGTEGKVYVQIAGFGVDPLASDGTQYAGITFVAKGLLTTDHRMNPGDSSGAQGTGANGGWEHCEMRSYLTDTILPKFPSALQLAIKTVTKYSDYVVPGETAITKNQAAQDKIWLLSAREVIGGSNYETQGPTYSSIFADSSARIMRKESSSTGSDWWLRTAYSYARFRYVASTGSGESNKPASSSCSICLGFCI